MVPPQLNGRLGFINPGLTLHIIFSSSPTLVFWGVPKKWYTQPMRPSLELQIRHRRMQRREGAVPLQCLQGCARRGLQRAFVEGEPLLSPQRRGPTCNGLKGLPLFSDGEMRGGRFGVGKTGVIYKWQRWSNIRMFSVLNDVSFCNQYTTGVTASTTGLLPG